MHSPTYPSPYQAWTVVLLFSALSMNQCAIWFSFACVGPDVVTGYFPKMDEELIRWTILMGNIGYYCGLPIVVALATGRGGLRACMKWSYFILLLSSGGICLCALEAVRQTEYAVPAIFVCLFLDAVIGPVVMALPAHLSAEWFPPEARGFPTSVAIAASTLGIVVWYPLGPLLAPTADDFPVILFIRLGCVALPAILCPVMYPKQAEAPYPRPEETPPLLQPKGAIQSDQVIPKSFPQRLRALFRLPPENTAQFVCIVVAASIQTGVSMAFGSFLQEAFHGRFSASFIGWAGFGMQLMGPFGNIIAGSLTDRMQPHLKRLQIGAVVIQTAMFGVLCLLTGIGESDPIIRLTDTENTILVLSSLVGIGASLGFTYTFLIVRAVAEVSSLPEAGLGAWTTFWNIGGSTVFLLFSTNFLTQYGVLMEFGVGAAAVLMLTAT